MYELFWYIVHEFQSSYPDGFSFILVCAWYLEHELDLTKLANISTSKG
jgi:hypothetical protein